MGIRIKADNEYGYMTAYPYDSILFQFIGRAHYPVKRGLCRTIDVNWHGGGIVVENTTVSNCMEMYISSQPIESNTNINEVDRMTFEEGKTYPGIAAEDGRGRYYWTVVGPVMVLADGTKEMYVVNADLPDGPSYRAVLDEDEKGATIHLSAGTTRVTASILPDNLRIRKLTPRECMRLMGYNDEEIDRLQEAKTVKTLKNGTQKESATFSNSALYRFAGNSVVVDCFAAILGEVVKDMESPAKGIDEW